MSSGSRIFLHAIAISAFLGLVLSAQSPAAAAAVEVVACEVWKSTAPTTIDKVKGTLASLFELKGDAASKPVTAEPEIFFTDKSSFSFQPVCRSGPPDRTEHLYYTFGLVVKKLGEIDLQERLWLVETEYGLKTFISPSNLLPLEKEKVYFFANDPNGLPYCLRQAENPCKAEEFIAGRQLSPQSRYGTAELSQFNRRGYGGRNYILLEEGRTCGVIHIGAYSGRKDGKPFRVEGGQLSTCEEAGTKIPKLKIVKWDDYDVYFKKKIDGNLLRTSPDLLGGLAKEFRDAKSCNTTVTFQSGSEAEIKGGGKVNFFVFELGGAASKKYIQSLKKEYGPNVALRFVAYDLTTNRAEAKANAVPIQISYVCDPPAEAPITAKEILVSHPTMGEFVIPIQNTDFKGDTTGILVVPMTGRNQLFLDGYVFKIEGAKDYMSRRDQILSIVNESYEKVQALFSDSRDDLYFSRTANFITHLIIAATAKPSRVPR